MIVMVHVADLSHEYFKSSRVTRWWLSRFGAKSSRECKPKWLTGLSRSHNKISKLELEFLMLVLSWLSFTVGTRE